jgi:alkylation response protein AidB-like acyl-CoA dehydrogenase
MNFAFSEDQDMIRKSAADFVKGQSSIERIRTLLHDPVGYSPELFRQMADSGWLGTVIPEEFGGIGLGYVDLVCIQEELGRGLIPEPLLTSAVLGANCILHGCVDEQKQELLPQVVSGDLKLTLAAYETPGATISPMSNDGQSLRATATS